MSQIWELHFSLPLYHQPPPPNFSAQLSSEPVPFTPQSSLEGIYPLIGYLCLCTKIFEGAKSTIWSTASHFRDGININLYLVLIKSCEGGIHIVKESIPQHVPWSITRRVETVGKYLIGGWRANIELVIHCGETFVILIPNCNIHLPRAIVCGEIVEFF